MKVAVRTHIATQFIVLGAVVPPKLVRQRPLIMHKVEYIGTPNLDVQRMRRIACADLGQATWNIVHTVSLKPRDQRQRWWLSQGFFMVSVGPVHDYPSFASY